MTDIKAIKPLVGCGASGQSLIAGQVYTVPDDISLADAEVLIRMGKVEPAREKKKRSKKAD